jgi:selenophosphate synthetase-related protein
MRGTNEVVIPVEAIVAAVRQHTGVTGKRPLANLRRFVDTSDPLHGPGDDGAVIDVDGRNIVACGEAISPPFVAADPYGAGIAAVLANVNDVAAMGGEPLGIVATLVGPRPITDEAMRGITDACRMYSTPLVGGHTTERDGDAALSAFAIGKADQVLSMVNVCAEQRLLSLCYLNGKMRRDFPFFSSLDHQGPRLSADIRLLAEAARQRLVVAAKDVSMAGSLGSLAMLLEFKGLGARINVDDMPAPADVDFIRWIISFPTFAFWLAVDPAIVAQCRAFFASNGLICEDVGHVSDDTSIVLSGASGDCELLDFAHEHVTGLWSNTLEG